MENKNAIVYCRVSSERQSEGVSLDAQEDMCKQYCIGKGYDVIKVIREATSAKDGKNLVKLEQVLEDKADFLIVYNVSRFSRNVVRGRSMASELRERESVMENLTPQSQATASADFVLTSLLNAAEYELQLLSQRTQLAIKHKKSQGFQFGGVPYGKKAGRTEDNIRRFEDDEFECNVMKFVKTVRGRVSLRQANHLLEKISRDEVFKPLELDDDGLHVIKRGLSCSNIAEILNDYGVFHRGRPWTTGAISRISFK